MTPLAFQYQLLVLMRQLNHLGSTENLWSNAKSRQCYILNNIICKPIYYETKHVPWLRVTFNYLSDVKHLSLYIFYVSSWWLNFWGSNIWCYKNCTFHHYFFALVILYQHLTNINILFVKTMLLTSNWLNFPWIVFVFMKKLYNFKVFEMVSWFN